MSDCARRVLIVDDETNMQIVLRSAFEDQGYDVDCASTGGEGIELLRKSHFDLALLDLRLPDMTGIDVFRAARQLQPGIIVIMITAYSSVDTAIEAMKMGAYDYVAKPFNVKKLLMVAANAVDARNDSVHSSAGWALSGLDTGSDDEEFGGVVGSTPHMKQLIAMAKDIAPTNATVLIYGESGTGKELLANFVHRRSIRSNRPFIKVNCAAIPEPLLESELFGHEKGAFTHAVSRRLGRFELADTGTVFLDEVGEMSPAMQSKLLRVLQEKEFERVGGSDTLKVDVRVIAATNCNLKQAVAEGAFREDLYYRLSVVPLSLPPLRERKQDLAALASVFIEKFNDEFAKSVTSISDDAMRRMMDYDWPGNIRELANAVERAVLLSRSDVLTYDDFQLGMNPACFVMGEESPGDDCRDEDAKAQRLLGAADDVVSLEELEREYIKLVLTKCKDNRTKASEVLKITRRTLLNKIKKYEL